MSKIHRTDSRLAIAGMGNVGEATARRLMGFADKLVLVSTRAEVKGLAMDLNDAMGASRMRKRTQIIGSTDYSATKNCDVVVITAGQSRKPGMSRDDLNRANAELLKPIVGKILDANHGHIPIFVIVTNQMDTMTYLATSVVGFENSSKVMGMGGMLDGARFAHQISKTLDITSENIHPCVLGEHGAKMVPVPELTTVTINAALSKKTGYPIGTYSLADLAAKGVIKESVVDDLIRATVNRGTEIVESMGRSAYVAPGMAVSTMVEHIMGNDHETVPASVYSADDGICMGRLVMLSHSGAEIVDMSGYISDSTKQKLGMAADAVRENLGKLQ